VGPRPLVLGDRIQVDSVQFQPLSLKRRDLVSTFERDNQVLLHATQTSHLRFSLRSGEQRKVATCEKVAEACIGIFSRGTSETVRQFYREVQDRVDESAGEFDWEVEYGSTLYMRAFDDARYAFGD